MRNTNSEVEEVDEVKEVEDSESRDLRCRGMFAGEEFRNLSSQGVQTQMSGGGLGFSFTSFTSFASMAFIGVYE
jgi:hypothetical protein